MAVLRLLQPVVEGRSANLLNHHHLAVLVDVPGRRSLVVLTTVVNLFICGSLDAAEIVPGSWTAILAATCGAQRSIRCSTEKQERHVQSRGHGYCWLLATATLAARLDLITVVINACLAELHSPHRSSRRTGSVAIRLPQSTSEAPLAAVYSRALLFFLLPTRV